MKVTKDQLNLENGLTKEWIITNGIGGFASSTIIGANTRRYHGLLVASLMPPAKRYLLLSKVDESISVNNNKYNLYTNVCEKYISKGFEYQESFEKKYIPKFEYSIEKIKITKMICMEYGKNTVGIYYKIANKNNSVADFELTPIINFRDFHQMKVDKKFEINQTKRKNKIKLIINENKKNPIYMKLIGSKYKMYDKKNIFENMFYIEEQKRGFDPIENHLVPGTFSVEIEPNETKELSFVFSLEKDIDEINVKALINNEMVRLNKIFRKSELITPKNTESENNLLKAFMIAGDNFIVYRPSFKLHTVIAGYPWFLDWGRDTLISFEGLLLVTKRYKEAKEVLQTFTKDIKEGLVPNGYSELDDKPLYNSADASLLLFEQIEKYLQYTNDYKFVQEIFEKLESIIKFYINGTNIDNNNIYLDSDGLIVTGTKTTQNTWMDAKIGNEAITPRNGKAVEINALWYNALMTMKRLSYKFGKRKDSNKYKEFAKKCKDSFVEKFYNKNKKCLYDVLEDEKIRPNQLFSLSLTYPVINPKSTIAKNIIKVTEKELLTKYGLRTLSSKDDAYVEIYEGSSEHRDRSYHQGITWVWLLGLYYNALKNIAKETKTKQSKENINKFVKKIYKTFEKEIDERGCIGNIAEIYNSDKVQEPKGTIAQAWSVAEVLRIILKK